MQIDEYTIRITHANAAAPVLNEDQVRHALQAACVSSLGYWEASNGIASGDLKIEVIA